MIALLLALQAAAAPTLPLPSALGPQSLPRQGCAAYLWSVSDRKLVAIAGADPATLRVAIGGKPVDYPLASQSGTAAFGFATSARYAGADLALTLDMTVTTEAELTDGGLVPQGTLTIERRGADALVVPVAGLVGCAPAR